MYYKNIYSTNNAKLNKELFDVNKQISSGLKIQYAKEDVNTFTETMRLDNELTSIGQVKKSTESGYKLSDQTDTTLNEFESSMNRFRTLLVNAANGTNDQTSLNAIAGELRGIEKNLKSLANTSINGQYLFSGSAVNTKPISDDGTYNGNDASLNAFLGSQTYQQYNISGAELFLGEETRVNREVSTNVKQSLNAPSSSSTLSTNSTMSEFMGDANAPNNHYFYVRGTQSDGTTFNQKIPMLDTETVGDLLTKIGKGFGNTGDTKIVDVSLNGNGEIVIKDKKHGSSKLDFHIVGATDFSGGGAANVSNIENLDSGTTNYATASSGAGSLYIKEFVKSSFDSATTNIATNDALLYDRTMFNVSGNTVSSNIPQIDKTTNAFATNATKLLDVASGTTLDGKQLKFKGTDTGGNAFTVQIDLKNSGSTFSVDGGTTNYSIFDMGDPRQAVDSDKMTYRQLMDVMNIVATQSSGSLDNTEAGYDNAVATANNSGNMFLSSDGKMKFEDLNIITTKVTMSLNDANSGNFVTSPATTPSSVLTFNANNALTIRDPKTDLFATINDMITAVENNKLYPDHSVGSGRGVGIEDAITMMDDLQDHIFSAHAQVGANSNTLTKSLEKTKTLEISTMSLRSSVIDTDFAESALRLQQLTLNYQAMLSTVGKVSKLSLVNYL